MRSNGPSSVLSVYWVFLDCLCCMLLNIVAGHFGDVVAKVIGHFYVEKAQDLSCDWLCILECRHQHWLVLLSFKASLMHITVTRIMKIFQKGRNKTPNWRWLEKKLGLNFISAYHVIKTTLIGRREIQQSQNQDRFPWHIETHFNVLLLNKRFKTNPPRTPKLDPAPL